MADIGILVMVAEDCRAQIDEIADRLEGAGLRVADKLPRFRSIVGSGDPSLIETLKSVDGVELVREERGYQLPPMDPDVPQ